MGYGRSGMISCSQDDDFYILLYLIYCILMELNINFYIGYIMIAE